MVAGPLFDLPTAQYIVLPAVLDRARFPLFLTPFFPSTHEISRRQQRQLYFYDRVAQHELPVERPKTIPSWPRSSLSDPLHARLKLPTLCPECSYRCSFYRTPRIFVESDYRIDASPSGRFRLAQKSSHGKRGTVQEFLPFNGRDRSSYRPTGAFNIFKSEIEARNSFSRFRFQ